LNAPRVLSPDCRVGKHSPGTPERALDPTTDNVVDCGCTCHQPDYLSMAGYVAARLADLRQDAVQQGVDLDRWHRERIHNADRARGMGLQPPEQCGCQGCLLVASALTDEQGALHPDAVLQLCHSLTAITAIARGHAAQDGPTRSFAELILQTLAQSWTHCHDFPASWREA
jgi:hypothetical protein